MENEEAEHQIITGSVRAALGCGYGRRLLFARIFDRARVAIGFQFLTGKSAEHGAVALRRHDGGCVIHGKGFFAKHGIDPAKVGGRYTPQVVKDRAAKMLFVIRLRTTAQSPSPRRRQNRR